MRKSKSNANQQNQRQQTMADNNQASTSSSLPPKKDKHIAKRPKKGPPPPVTPKDIATVTEFDISDICATYDPKTPSPTSPPTQIILPSNSLSSAKEKEKLVKNCQTIFLISKTWSMIKLWKMCMLTIIKT